MATRKGTRGVDKLTGTTGADLILGYLGSDTLSGLGGVDNIFGGGGRDLIYGGASSDRLFGGSGKDKIYGGTGNDYIDHNGGLLGTGRDDNSADFISAGSGNDTVLIGKGDSASGGTGFDTLNLFFEPVSSAQLYAITFANVHKAASSNIGFGLTKAGLFESVNFSAASSKSGSTLIGSKGSDTLSMTLDFNSVATSTQGVSISGGSGNDHITGSQKNDILKGNSGNDTIAGGGGDDRMTGATGQDVFAFYLTPTLIGDTPVATITDFSLRDDVFAFSSYGPSFGDESNLLLKGVGITNGNTAAGIAQFIYDTSTGSLSLDSNGSTAGGVIQVAILANKANITARDISVDYEIAGV